MIGDLPVDKGKDHLFSDHPPVPFILRIDGDRRIPQHRFGPRRGDHDPPLPLGEGIADAPELARLGLVLHLQVGDGGPAAGAPVDDIVPLVDEAVVVQTDEHLADRLGEALIHGEAFARPVAGAAEPFELMDDDPAVLRLPLPHPFDELLPAEIMPGESLLRQLLLHDVLRRDPRMVHPRHPEGVIPLHPLVADDDVLEDVVEGMPHMEHPRHVRRRDDDGKGFPGTAVRRMEKILIQPVLIPFRLRLTRLVHLCQLITAHASSPSSPHLFRYRNSSLILRIASSASAPPTGWCGANAPVAVSPASMIPREVTTITALK